MSSLNTSRHPFKAWLVQRQKKNLEQAYNAAQLIRALEDQYFDGKPIAPTPGISQTVTDYVKSLRDRQLLKLRLNLSQFRLNSFLLDQPQTLPPAASDDREAAAAPSAVTATPSAPAPEMLEKLVFIDAVIGRYRDRPEVSRAVSPDLPPSAPEGTATRTMPSPPAVQPRNNPADEPPAIADILTGENSPPRPTRLFGGRLSLGREFNPRYEVEMLQALRQRRQQSRTAITWLVILIVVPLLMAFLAQKLVFGPLLGTYADKHPTQIELSAELKAEFAAELIRFREELEVRELLGLATFTPDEIHDQMEEAATELWRESREAALSGYRNLLSDGVGLLVFVGLVYFNRNKIAAIRSFSNATFLSLTDPTKVFLFILITDMFVGFHSAEGWETLLRSFQNHLALPENEAAINTFIATVPVILDACIKFWIFSYLTRFSPSASAVYERMNT